MKTILNDIKIENNTRVSNAVVMQAVANIFKSDREEDTFYFKVSGHISTKIKIKRKQRVLKGKQGRDDKTSLTFKVELYYGDGKQTKL